MGKLNMDAMKEKLNSENNSRGYNAEYDSLQAGKNVRRVLWAFSSCWVEITMVSRATGLPFS